MSVRPRGITQENDGVRDLDFEPCDKQYAQMPYVQGGIERKRDHAAISHGGDRSPLQNCLTVVVVCLSIIVFLMPFLALNKLPNERKDVAWWKGGVVYHIYIRSFYDFNGDGVGDLKGVQEKFGYLADLGIKAVQLSPFYSSPMVDLGYDVSNHTEVDPIFGTLKDFDELVEDLHVRDMKVIIDFIPNHTADKHTWFRQSARREGPYTDFYIWSDGKVDKNGQQVPPNNWLSSFGGPAWTWHEGRQQFYYHRYAVEMPDLNYRNPKVIEAMQGVLEFWLQRGVDGFQVNAVGVLMENKDQNLDEPRTYKEGFKPTDFHYLDHIHTAAQSESLSVLAAFHEVVNKYALKNKKDIIIVPEINIQKKNPNFWMKSYENGGSMPTNKALTSSVKAGFTGHKLHRAVNHVMKHVPFDKGNHWINWFAESHDHGRLPSRIGERYTEAGLALTLLLPGTGIIYYGQELGLTDLNLTYEQTIDPKGCNAGKENYQEKSRDPSRGPMQWSHEKNAGFSSAEQTWLPVNSDYKRKNVQKQLADPESVLNSFKRMMALRKEPAFLLGQHNPMIVTGEIYSFARISRGCSFPHFIVAMNIGSKPSINNYQNTKVSLKIPEDFIEAPVKIPPTGTVVYQSSNFETRELVGQSIAIDRLELFPGEVIVVRI